MSEALLDGLVVLDMSQFLSGPFAALRLGDLGARVIKIERPDGGDLCRRLYLTDTEIGGDSTLFHAINRGKQGFAADFKNPADVAAVKSSIRKADVMIQNFRPGVIERLGLDYETARAINPGIVYASITGYGEEGPWAMLPGQDLLAQARSGLMWLNGDDDQGPCRSASRSPICWRAARSCRACSPRWCGAAGPARARISRRASSRRWSISSSRC